MSDAMARFATVVRDTVSAHGGVMPVEQGEGDSFVAAFARASGAAACAFELQREWSDGSWPFSVRMALHTGEVQTRGAGNYEGPTIIRCARLRAIAHGGQVVLSQATRDLVADDLPSGAWLDDMGVHSLKDLDRPEHVSQLRHPDLPLNATPLVSSGAPPPNNLPTQLTSFVGRTREIATVLELMHANRMVTLLGTGGAGKTRLSLRVAEEATDRHPDGVWFVDLTPVEDPNLVGQAVATTMGVREQVGRPVEETIAGVAAQPPCARRARQLRARRLGGGFGRLRAVVGMPDALDPGDVPRGPRGSRRGDVHGARASRSSPKPTELFVGAGSRRRGPGFALTADNDVRGHRRSANASTASLWRSSSPRRVCRMMSPEQIRDGLDRPLPAADERAVARCCRGSRRCGDRWTGATRSSPTTNDGARAGCRSSLGGFDLEAAQAVVADDRITAFRRARPRRARSSTSRSSSPTIEGARCATACSRRSVSTEPSDLTRPTSGRRLPRRHREHFRALPAPRERRRGRSRPGRVAGACHRRHRQHPRGSALGAPGRRRRGAHRAHDVAPATR